MKRILLRSFLCIFFCFLFPLSLSAKDLTVAIAKMPVISETPERGILIDFVHAMAKAEGINIKIKVQPFARTLSSLKKGKVDFQMPFTELPKNQATKLGVQFSKENIFHVNFVLYTNKSKKITLDNLKNFRLETDLAHVNYFPFGIKPSSCIECSLKKVNSGRTDGFIFAEAPSDPVVRRLKLSNIKRQLYKKLNVKMTLPLGEKGRMVEEILSSAIKKIRANGMLAKTVGTLDIPYDNWQP